MNFEIGDDSSFGTFYSDQSTETVYCLIPQDRILFDTVSRSPVCEKKEPRISSVEEFTTDALIYESFIITVGKMAGYMTAFVLDTMARSELFWYEVCSDMCKA